MDYKLFKKKTKGKAKVWRTHEHMEHGDYREHGEQRIHLDQRHMAILV